IDWHEYVARLYHPLQEWLMASGWMTASAMDLFDDAGRRKLSPSGHRISYLVTCRGVPLKIRSTPDVPADVPETLIKSLQTNQGAVDSELSLMVQGPTPRHGMVR